jgi:5-methylthioribose kinase
MSFDIGAVIGNLLLSYASHEVRIPDTDKRAYFRRYLINTIIQLWKVFEREFQKIWDQVDSINMPRGYQDDYMFRLLQDSAGMAACKMMRRVISLAGVEDIRGIENLEDRSIAASLALNIAYTLFMHQRDFHSIEELVGVTTYCSPNYPWK